MKKEDKLKATLDEIHLTPEGEIECIESKDIEVTKENLFKVFKNGKRKKDLFKNKDCNIIFQ